MIVSGAPERTPDHAVEILNMAFEMLEQINMLRNPATGKTMRIRIGLKNYSLLFESIIYKLKRFFFKLRMSYWFSSVWCGWIENAKILFIWRNCYYWKPNGSYK